MGLRLGGDSESVDLAKRQIRLAGERDNAVRNLRDLTIAIAVVATGGVALAAWVSAATIPGTTGTSSAASPSEIDDSGNAATQPVYPADQGLAPTRPGNSQLGSGVAVSGGSR